MRELNATVLSEAAQSVTSIAVLVELNFSTGFLRMTNAPANITHGGWIYNAVGSLGNIAAVTEDSGLSSPGLRMTLSGIDATAVGAAIDETYYGRDATVYLQFLDNDDQPTGAAITAWQGVMDRMTVTLDAGSATIDLTCESRMASTGQRVRIRSDETLQRRYAGDTFYSFLDQLADISIDWGGQRVIAAGGVLPDVRGGGRGPGPVDP